MTRLDNILKSRDITLPTKVCLVKAMVFSSSHVWMWELDYKESCALKNLCFWIVVLGEDSWESLGLLRVQSNPKSTLNIHWKDWSRSWSSNTLATWCEELTHWKRPCCWKHWRQEEEKGSTRGWDVWMTSPTQWYEFEQAPGVGDGQGGLVCRSSWGRSQTRLSDWTELSAILF